MGGPGQLYDRPARTRRAPAVAPGRAGRDDALAVLFDLQYVTLVAAARFIVDDRETAEDVVMEAFVNLHRRWAPLRDHGGAHRYHRSSVLNGAHSRLRHGRVGRVHEAQSLVEPTAPGDLAARADHVALVRGIHALAPRQREVLVMRSSWG